MSYKTVMVHQNLDGAGDSRLQIATELAHRFRAKLIGIAAAEVNPPAYGNNSLVMSIVAQLRQQTETQLNEAASRFRAAAEGAGQEFEWRQAIAKPTEFLAQQARAADLIVTGVLRGNVYIDRFTEMDTGGLLMESGRPVLVVPPGVESLKAKHILVAWKDTREARRAVADALPLLQAASDVTVAEVSGRDDVKGAARSCDDVAAWLKRHGVAAGGNAVVAEDPFDALQGLLTQNAADLIVAGAYGHSRVQEWIFGGVTQDLLKKAKCCCLLAS